MSGPQKKLWYYCSCSGSGTIEVHFCASAEQATELDEAQLKWKGWGDVSVGYANLSIEDGKLYLEKIEWTSKGRTTEKIEIV